MSWLKLKQPQSFATLSLLTIVARSGSTIKTTIHQNMLDFKIPQHSSPSGASIFVVDTFAHTEPPSILTCFPLFIFDGIADSGELKLPGARGATSSKTKYDKVKTVRLKSPRHNQQHIFLHAPMLLFPPFHLGQPSLGW